MSDLSKAILSGAIVKSNEMEYDGAVSPVLSRESCIMVAVVTGGTAKTRCPLHKAYLCCGPDLFLSHLCDTALRMVSMAESALQETAMAFWNKRS